MQDIMQIPLAERIPALANSVRVLRAQLENTEKELAHTTDQLARSEAEVLGKAANSEGVALSGLIEDNPYAPNAPVTANREGDQVDPATGEGSGGAPAPGSGSSPRSASPR